MLELACLNDRCNYCHLRIDKGYQRGALNLEGRFITVIGVTVCYRYSERAYFSLFNDAYIILIGQNLIEL